MTIWTALASAAGHTINTTVSAYKKTCEWEVAANDAVRRGEMKTTGGRTWDEYISDTHTSMHTAYTAVRTHTTPVATPTTTLLAQASGTPVPIVEAPKAAPTTPKVGMVAKVKGVFTRRPKVEAPAIQVQEDKGTMDQLFEEDVPTVQDHIKGCSDVLAWMALNPVQGPEIEAVPVKVKVYTEVPTPAPIPTCTRTHKPTWRETKPSLGSRLLDLVCPLNKDVVVTSIVDLKGDK